MKISSVDWIIIIFIMTITVIVGIYSSRKASKDTSQFFLSGKKMPWWLLGISMVATTFSTDTPNLVTDIVRNNGVSGNWVWWAFMITGFLTVFVYARLWRRTGINSDNEFYDIRYSGKAAKFLKSFRAVYLGLIFNVLAMSGISLAAIKIGEIIFNLQPIETIFYAGVITVLFSTLGGFRGVVLTDFFLFFIAMSGSIMASVFIVNMPEIGGVVELFNHENVKDKISFLPDFNKNEDLIILFIIPLSVQWWSSWYPGAEPGGGGYIAQRMLASKNEKDAVYATLFFNIMHYAIRPWPWILIALCSLIIFPDLNSISDKFPALSENKLGHDVAYSAMLTFLPTGLIGLVVASLISAYVSTISTHLNWGALYLVNDILKPIVTSEKKLVRYARFFTIFLFVISSLIALSLTNALQLFNFILMFGAGTGLIFILRWFWFRINAWSEISAMFFSGFISIILNMQSTSSYLFGDFGIFQDYMRYPIVVFTTTIFWLIITYVTEPEDQKVINSFKKRIGSGTRGFEFEKYLISNIPNILLSVCLVISILVFIGSLLKAAIYLSIFSFMIICTVGYFLILKINKTS
mgnify:FL=1